MDIQLGKMLSPAAKVGTTPKPYLRNANVQWGRFDLADVALMDFDDRERAKFRLRRGDLLVCEGGEPGRSAVWDNEMPEAYYQKALHRLRPNAGDADPRFMMYRLWLGAQSGEFGESHARTTIAHLPAVRLHGLRIALPPLSEQRRIAARLTEQLAAVERARAAARERSEAAESLRPAYLQAEFEAGARQGWPLRKIAEIAETGSGLTPSRARPDYFGGTIPWVKTAELRDGLVWAAEERITATAVQETGIDVLPERTVLVAMYGQGQTRGRTGILGTAAATNQACFAIRPNDGVFEPRYLQYWLRSQYGFLRSATEGRGGNQPNLNGEILRDLAVPLPPVPVQREVVQRLDELERVAGAGIAAAVAELAAIAALSPALVRQAFRQAG